MSEFANTSINMVQVVDNIIRGYAMGPIRALAQEPVQNARDAHNSKTVHVTYRLLRRRTDDDKRCFMLTVSDRGTFGLRGPVLTPKDLQDRQFRLKPVENWAAFEGHGYTKENEDALGSRGQGKSTFLFHSTVPREQRQMLMLYDTLLESGEYRLGVRYARPIDQVLYPPLKNDEARKCVQEDYYKVDEGLRVPLGLEPLEHVGTRVIIPFLSREALHALRDGKLERWLQRCWWRAIQTQKVSITVIDEEAGWEHEVEIPEWWKGYLLNPSAVGKLERTGTGIHRLIQENTTIENSEIRIKRLALLYDEHLAEDEIHNDHPEYSGIQILRGQQWIETIGTVSRDLVDLIPAERRAGFRGFVEFDRSTEAILREIEKPQHDGFDGRRGGHMSKIRNYLKGEVRNFSEEMGWKDKALESQKDISRREKRTLQRFVDTFLPQVSGHKGKGKGGPKDENGKYGLRWDCHLFVEYPESETSRVDWGHQLRNVSVQVEWEPTEDWPGSADLALELVTDAATEEIWCEELNGFHSGFEHKLGNWRVLKDRATSEKRQIACPEPGKYRLRAVVKQNNKRVAQSSRAFYVQEEPPSPPEKKPQALSISLENASVPGQRRFDDGQIARLQINAKNRLTQDATVKISASIRGFKQLLNEEVIRLPGTPAGDTPRRERALFEEIRLLLPGSSVQMRESETHLVLEAGSYTVQADLFDDSGNKPAHASERLYFEHDPKSAGNNLPFELSQIETDSQAPMWELNVEQDTLSYPGGYPLWKELRDVTRQHSALAGKSAFTCEIIANGLLEWALRPLLETQDDSRILQLKAALQNQNGNSTLWDKYERYLDDLEQGPDADSYLEYAITWRKTVSVMLDIFGGKES